MGSALEIIPAELIFWAIFASLSSAVRLGRPALEIACPPIAGVGAPRSARKPRGCPELVMT